MGISRRLTEKIDRLLSLEKGTVYKDHGGRIRIALIYPNKYSIGMSNLGFQGIYGLLNDRSDTVCERAFMPDEVDMEEHHRTGSGIFSFESRTALKDFDILAFSLSFEQDYPNIVKLLSMSGIPLRSSQRGIRDPLLIAGGICCFSNPEPFADIFDLIFIGEAEVCIHEFLNCYKGFPRSDRDALKSDCSSIEGIYVPEFYESEVSEEGGYKRRVLYDGAPEMVRRVFFKDFSRSCLSTRITSPKTEFANMILIEAIRGCHWNCRFCLAGSVYNPPRIRDKDVLCVELSGFSDHYPKGHRSTVGLIAPSISDYPFIEEMIANEGVRFSITSLRANKRCLNLIDLLRDKKSLSIAPEAGTDRMRRAINKRITEEDILMVSGHILRSGIETLRLYFMIGLPFETIEDIEGIISIVKKIRSLNSSGNISVTLSVFVPKPFTPFQWHGFADLKETKDKLHLLKRSLMSIKGINVHCDGVRDAYVQAVFARGGRAMLKSIITASETGSLRHVVRDDGLRRAFMVPWSLEAPLPWDFIDNGIAKEALWREYKDALSQLES